MSIETVRAFLLWCFVLNYVLLLFWVVLVLFAHDWSYRMTSRFFRMSVEQFDAIQYGGIALYKILVILFNLVPYVALLLVR